MRLASCLAVSALAACTAPPLPTPTPDLPTHPTDQLAVHDGLDRGRAYLLETGESRADIVVRRAGALQRFGHDHVITAADITGLVLVGSDDASASWADLTVNLGSLTVDDPGARSVYGLDTEPNASDIDGTTENLRTKVLETARWPAARVEVQVTAQDAGSARCIVTLTVRGRSHRFPVDVLLEEDDVRFRARGLFAINQTALGIEPFSILGGALAVRDRIEISFRIEASRIDALEAPPRS